jgi:cytochrome P450
MASSLAYFCFLVGREPRAPWLAELVAEARLFALAAEGVIMAGPASPETSGNLLRRLEELQTLEQARAPHRTPPAPHCAAQRSASPLTFRAQVWQEVFRLYPPFPGGCRGTTEEAKVAGHSVPKDFKVGVQPSEAGGDV